ncbi:hypothetical protein LENED_012178 [Lentinula edodes]|uniref:Uncharacterized protein n=1 Tax=Lentinula edodes TaxID=5353 RepID=A0A1Q3ERW9_LENED|nr:hypothetical protein LENED_012178 [Lentinula edodes]
MLKETREDLRIFFLGRCKCVFGISLCYLQYLATLPSSHYALNALHENIIFCSSHHPTLQLLNYLCKQIYSEINKR